MSSKPLIAVSRCILGENVRYDAKIKHFPELVDFIKDQFEFILVCPEVEIGLSVPRPPVQLTGSVDNIRVTGRDNPELDITDAMRDYCQTRPAQLNSICGYIFKSKSPSCGTVNIPVFDSTGSIINSDRGVFVNAMLQHLPELPITDEVTLQSNENRKQFLKHVFNYQQSLTS